MFTKRLTALRNQHKLTQKELAEKLNIGRSALSLYEIGQREPDLQLLCQMADFFQVSTDYLLGRTDHPTGTVGCPDHLTDPGREKAFPPGQAPDEKKEQPPAEARLLPYLELIQQWEAAGLSPVAVKKIWESFWVLQQTVATVQKGTGQEKLPRENNR